MPGKSPQRKLAVPAPLNAFAAYWQLFAPGERKRQLRKQDVCASKKIIGLKLNSTGLEKWHRATFLTLGHDPNLIKRVGIPPTRKRFGQDACLWGRQATLIIRIKHYLPSNMLLGS
jgi:hypothetical protein